MEEFVVGLVVSSSFGDSKYDFIPNRMETAFSRSGRSKVLGRLCVNERSGAKGIGEVFRLLLLVLSLLLLSLSFSLLLLLPLSLPLYLELVKFDRVLEGIIAADFVRACVLLFLCFDGVIIWMLCIRLSPRGGGPCGLRGRGGDYDGCDRPYVNQQ